MSRNIPTDGYHNQGRRSKTVARPVAKPAVTPTRIFQLPSPISLPAPEGINLQKILPIAHTKEAFSRMNEYEKYISSLFIKIFAPIPRKMMDKYSHFGMILGDQYTPGASGRLWPDGNHFSSWGDDVSPGRPLYTFRMVGLADGVWEYFDWYSYEIESELFVPQKLEQFRNSAMVHSLSYEKKIAPPAGALFYGGAIINLFLANKSRRMDARLMEFIEGAH